MSVRNCEKTKKKKKDFKFRWKYGELNRGRGGPAGSQEPRVRHAHGEQSIIMGEELSCAGRGHGIIERHVVDLFAVGPICYGGFHYNGHMRLKFVQKIESNGSNVIEVRDTVHDTYGLGLGRLSQFTKAHNNQVLESLRCNGRVYHTVSPICREQHSWNNFSANSALLGFYIISLCVCTMQIQYTRKMWMRMWMWYILCYNNVLF